MFDFQNFQKTVEANQALAREVATQLTTAAVEFSKVVVDTNTKVAATVRDQLTDAYNSVKTMPGFDAFAPKATSKKSKVSE
jgi:flagellar hook-basal body complex protein FliE